MHLCYNEMNCYDIGAYMERQKRQFHSIEFDAKRLTHITWIITASIVCLMCAYIFTHPIPEDTALKITSIHQLLGGDDRDSFAVIDMDVSATEVMVHDNGQVHTIYVSDGTIANALETVGIVLGEFDELSVDDDTQISDGMHVYITRVTVEEEYTYEPIPYETVMQPSSSLYTGNEIVVQEGEDGVRQYTYDIIYKNGVMTDRVLAGTSVYVKPVNQVVAYGTSTSIPPSSTVTVSTTSQLLTLEDGTQIPYNSYIDVVATAYTTEGQSFKITKSGATAQYGIIAVDPKVIPMGTRMYILAEDGSWIYGYAVAGDTGGFIKGNRIDLFYDTRAECIDFGRQNARVYILE